MGIEKKKVGISDKLNVIGRIESYPNIPHIEMENCLRFLPSTLSKIMP
jgi:hypothetical protein